MFHRPGNQYFSRVLATSLLALAVTILMPAANVHAAIADTWSWPLAPPWRIERSYQSPPTPYGIGHRGIDLAATLGTSVLAPAPGTVIFAGTIADRGVISIDHGGGITSSFEPVTATVVAGERVEAGDVIGLVSEGNHCVCLHLGARVKGEYISPLAFLSTIDRAVLLPWRD